MSDKHWFVYVTDHHEGPFTRAEVEALLQSGSVNKTSYLWKEGFEDWTMLSDVPEFQINGEGHGPVAFVTDSTPRKHIVKKAEGYVVEDVDQGICLYRVSKGYQATYSGPYEAAVIGDLVSRGEVSQDDLVWKPGWKQFQSIRELDYFSKRVIRPVPDAESTITPKKSLMAKVLPYGVYIFGLLIFMSLAASVVWISRGHLKIEKYSQPIKAKATEIIRSKTEYLPRFLLDYVSLIPRIEGLTLEQMQALRTATMKKLSEGVSFHVTRRLGDDYSPELYISTNLPSGFSLRIVLKSRHDGVLSEASVERQFSAVVSDGLVKTQRFTIDGKKPLPKGEYILTITESTTDQANNDNLLRLHGVNQLNQDLSYSEFLFLGGKKDAEYQQKLNELLEQKRKIAQEAELYFGQYSATLEAAIADVRKFLELKKVSLVDQKTLLHSRSVLIQSRESLENNKNLTTLPQFKQLFDLTEEILSLMPVDALGQHAVAAKDRLVKLQKIESTLRDLKGV